jgi:hypothetical protein
MLFKEIIDVYSGNRTKPIYTLSRLGSVTVSVPATGPKVRGLRPAEAMFS